ncbi:MAG: glycosyltransferase family 39 protein [Deltaproteobacteria bacterium]|nr:glycosyltransferase family 39 protein [Deltaproteobacteria bacterium]
MASLGKTLWLLVGATALIALAKGAVAASHGLLADEAYYWVWSQHLAWGYYDQPPAIAWVIRVTTALGHTPLAVRLGALIAGLAPLLTLRFAGDRGLWVLWWAGVPPLLWLTLFATSDAPLLLGWTATLAGALAGGPWWLLAGAGAALAGLSKYSGLAALPLAILAAGPASWRSRWPWLGLALALGLIAPHLRWLAGHEAVSVQFQLGEGWMSPRAPGWVGIPQQLGDQLLVVGPLTAMAGLVWAVAVAGRLWRERWDQGLRARVERTAWLSSVPIFAFFALSAVGGPPEAHWTAPGLVGLGLGLSWAGPRLRRAVEVGLWLGVLASLALVAHAWTPVLSLPPGKDPAARLGEGAALGPWVGAWARPAGAALDQRGGDAIPVLTERYQEAALIAWETGLPASVLPGCGRGSQYDLWAEGALPARALFVRPRTSGDPTCTEEAFPRLEGPAELEGRDAHGRLVGRWQLFELAR